MSHALLRRLFPTDEHHVRGLHTVVQQLMPERGRILDLGCGTNSELASYRIPDREIWGTDFEVHPNVCQPEWFRALGSSGSIPFPDDTFDLVVAIMVMEHVESPCLFFSEVARVLRPGGSFVGHTISGNHYVTWLVRLVGLLPHSVSQWLVRKLYGRAEEDTFPTFYRLNRRAQIERACRLTELNLAALTRYADPGYFQIFGPLQAAAVVADRLLEWVAAGCGRLYFTVTIGKADISSSPKTEMLATEDPYMQRQR